MILENPLVAIGGYQSESASVMLLMHKGYDDFYGDLDAICRHAIKKGRGRHLMMGTLLNPLFEWPVYADVSIS